jgi:glycosyltransferase involved in cell wall biosynthesis
MRRFYRDFAVVFSRSDAYANVLQRDIGIERERIRTIPYGTKLSSFSPSFEDDSVWHQYKEVRESSAKVLYVGRLSVEKNFPFLVDLCRSFRRGLGQNIDAQLVAVGEGYFLEQRDAWLRDDIVLLGYKKGIELSTLYASSQLFLFPSLTDTLGQTVMEAQASGLPVICSDAGGPKNIVTDQKSGFVLPIDHLQWMRSLFLLLSSDGHRRSMGQYAHTMMKERDISLSFESFWEEQIGCIE